MTQESTNPGAVNKPPKQPTVEEKVYQIYAALGELSVRKKQTEQLLSKINEKTDLLEKELVKILGAKNE